MWTKARRGYTRLFHAQSPARGKFWISKSLGTSVVVHTNKEKYGVAIDPILFWKSQAVVGFECFRGEEVKAAFERGGRSESVRTELAFVDHPLVPVDLMFDPIQWAIALSEEQTNDFIAAFGGLIDAALREKFH
jgi:hypothetical protein